jgi:hypothetical protein
VGEIASLRWHRGVAASVVAMLLALAIPLAGCGESKEEQAKKTVCAARSDIDHRVNTLKTISPSIANVPQIKEEVSAIADDVKKIQGAQGDLEPSRRHQVEQATSTFTGDVSSVLSNLVSAASLSDAEKQLEDSLRKLGEDYVKALGPIECS